MLQESLWKTVEIKSSNPSKWFSIAKQIGLPGYTRNDKTTVECVEGLTDIESANQVAAHFANISQEYDPISTENLPAFLPSFPPPELHEYQVYQV